jgi:pentatricopeptide repeat protein
VKGKTQEARELFLKMQINSLCVAHAAYKILIKRYCKEAKLHKALKLYEEMEVSGLLTTILFRMCSLMGLAIKELFKMFSRCIVRWS